MNFMYLSIVLPYEEYIEAFERLWVLWIIVNIMKYDYYYQNAKYMTYGAVKQCIK